MATLAFAVLLGSCGSSSSSNPGTGGSGDTGGSGGSTGGTGPSGTGGQTATGGSGTGGAATGGSGDTGGSPGTGGMADVDSGAAGDDASAGTGGASGDGGTSAMNPCPAKVTNYTLNNFPVADFCDAYEKYCKYTPDGSMMSKCGPGQKVGPLFKDRADCEMQYMMASAAGKACRAGQLCQNAPRGLIVNACSHATGYCAPTCGK